MSDFDDEQDMGGDDGREDGDRQDRKEKDYEIGYRKPPRATQWPKGTSGNPRGPKKGSRGLKKDLHKALGLPHSIRVDGRTVRGTTQEMAMYTLAKRAGTGDLRAIREMVDLVLKIFGPEDRGRERTTLSPQDQELLGRMLGREETDLQIAAGNTADADDDDDNSACDADMKNGADGDDGDANENGADEGDQLSDRDANYEA